MEKVYDSVIVGAGPAGMTAAIYMCRAGKTALMLDQLTYGGNIAITPEVENYPAIKHISGFEFAQNMYDQATSLGAEFKAAEVTGIENEGSIKIVKTGEGDFKARTVIIATGVKTRKLGLENESRYEGMGISYCATCDGAFFKGRDVAVIGGGDVALEDAEYLSGIANHVYLIHRRDEFRGNKATARRLERIENIEFVLDSIPVEYIGDQLISGLKVRNKKTEEERVLDVQGIFVAVGSIPSNEAFENVLDLDKAGYGDADEDCLTRTEGVFVAGDCRRKKVRQLSTATSDGTVAAIAAQDYINQMTE